MPPAGTSPATIRDRPRLHYALVVIAAGFLGSGAANGLARFGYTVVLPPMREGLGLSDAEAGLLGSANLLGYLLFTLLAGALASRYGARLVGSLSLAWAGATLVLTGLATTFEFALAMRLLTGMGSAGGNMAIMGLPAAWAAPSRRGLAAGIIVGGSGLGLLLVGYLVPAVVQAYGDDGWRSAWYWLGALTLGIAALGYALLRDSPSEKGLAPLGARPSAEPRVPNPESRVGPLRTRHSGLSTPSWGEVYRSRELWSLGGVYAVWAFVYIIYATFFARYLTAEVGYRPAEAGALWSLVGAFSLFCGVVWGWVADRVGRRAALAGVFGLQGAAFLAFAAAPGLPGLAVLSAVLFGSTAWSTSGIMATLVGDYCGPRMASAGFGFITFLFAIAQTVGPYAGGYLADALGTFAPGFALTGGLLLANALASLRLPARAHDGA
ncbi:MAG: MFS transporter [Chloroflexi bacterium]|nr:MFS transporter [Chloroflexota bacterium]